jgi:hypothetical protein
MRKRRKAFGTWPIKFPGRYPQVYVDCTADDQVTLTAFEAEDGRCSGFISLSRHDARLLARRINQCLDATTLPLKGRH